MRVQPDVSQIGRLTVIVFPGATHWKLNVTSHETYVVITQDLSGRRGMAIAGLRAGLQKVAVYSKHTFII